MLLELSEEAFHLLNRRAAKQRSAYAYDLFEGTGIEKSLFLPRAGCLQINRRPEAAVGQLA